MSEICQEKNTLRLREQIYRELRELSVNSLPGTRLPSENALAAKFKVARMTASWAFRKLEEENLIERKKGCGSFVKGVRTVTYLLPNAEMLTKSGTNAAIHRECMQGVMRGTTRLQLRLEAAVINQNNNQFLLDFQRLSTFHSGSMVITSPWFMESFRYLAERRVRTAMISNQAPYYGSKQYTYDWFKLEADRRNAVRQALEMLYCIPCRKIAVTNLYRRENHHPMTETYLEFMHNKNLQPMMIDLLISDELSTYQYCNELRLTLQAAYAKERFEALLLNIPATLFGKNINEYCGLPENVRIFGINIQPIQCNLGEFFPYSYPPYAQMAEDAVELLAESQRLGISKRYDYIFRNTNLLNK